MSPGTSIVRESKEYAKVLFSYDAANNDELSLKEGDEILILDKNIEDEGWWKGELDGKAGVFPNNFVEIIETKPKRPAAGPTKRAERPLPPDPKLEKSKETPSKKPDLPPPPGKKTSKASTSKDSEDKKTPTHSEDVVAKFDAVQAAEPLRSLNVNRPKGPAKRPPSMELLKRDANDDDYQDEDLPWLDETDKPESNKDKEPTDQNDYTPLRSNERTGRRAPPLPPPPTPPPKQPIEKGAAKHSTPSPSEPNPAATAATAASAANAKLIDELSVELNDLRANTVSKDSYNELKNEVQDLREQILIMRKQFDKRITSLMEEIDEEKKMRLSNQVEMERVKKLAMSNNQTDA